ncbi:MAG: hypothetical protein KKA51_04040 [Nanoarchaeota archaeon]|nr:hypothetical protein [Nanoarchaeota archaeon]MBU2442884.1 hypothetical protein [Nanoarchaeota archaeon]
MLFKEQVLKIVKEKGPIIPNLIKRETGGDTFLVGAVLSELLGEGLIRISNTKIGNSPTYYCQGHEFKLLNLKKYLNEKDQRTIDLLREKKILKDTDQDMLIRVSLRNIKDFAKQLEVNVKGEKEVFWKWYLTSKEETEHLIKKEILGEAEPEQKKEEKQTPKEEPKKERTEEKQEIIKEEPKKERTEEKQEIIRQTKEPADDEFSRKLHNYFEKKEIEVEKETIIRKNSEIELQVIIPSAVGKVEYFCKAKNKKKCNDGDLSSAYIKGQMMKLPTLFITTGEVTKKAENMLKNEFKSLVLKKI